MSRRALWAMAAAMLVLAACGGSMDDGHQDAGPVDCTARPEVCR